MEARIEPRQELAASVLPRALREALTHVFTEISGGCMLVGGTALAGFYAGHRRSDDIDLFTKDAFNQEIVVRAVRSLSGLGAEIGEVQHTPAYYRSVIRWQGHAFTADVVLDSLLHRIGKSVRLPNGVVVAELDTILMTKSATLVSRASEKDLYDLIWILERFPELTIKDLLELAQKIDAGATAENVLISLLGAPLRVESCDFAIEPPLDAGEVFKKIEAFRKGLVMDLRAIAKSQPLPPLGELIRKLRSLRRRA